MKLTLRQIGQILNIKPIGKNIDTPLSIPITDSRSLLYPDDTIFFALTTSSNDGHRYIRELYRRGVRNFVVNKAMTSNLDFWDDANYLITDGSVVDALQQVARHIRSLVHCPIIAITGSRGKTIVKEMIAEACSNHLITKSPRSWNSQSGVPMSVWRLNENTGLGIFEAGISRPGEMERLEQIIRPTIGIFTGLTDEHAHNFESALQKCNEKALLFTHCTDIVYIDNDPVIEQALRQANDKATLHRAHNYDEIVTIVKTLLGYTESTDSYLPNISTRIDFTDGQEGNIFAYDHYSNDLDGIETALDRMARRLPAGTPLVTVLGDLQLHGMDPDKAYVALEKMLLQRNVDGIVAVGDTIQRYAAQFSSLLAKYYASSPEHFNRRFSTSDFPHSALLIKGKPGTGFECIKSRLEDSRHDTCLEVNIDALINNFNYYRSLVKPGTGMIAMVKADAYGAGAIEVARTLQSQGAEYLAVAVIEEGIALRRAGITMPIMVLNPISSNYTAIYEYKLEPTVFSLSELEALSHFAPTQNAEPYPIHVKLDTGMHRFGLNENELTDFISEIKKYPQLRVASIFSHLATADCPDMDYYTEFQLNNFEQMSEYLVTNIDYPVKRHILNTAGIMRYPQYQYDMVRLGIGLYGISPISDSADSHLRPVSRLVTTISALQQRHPGETVGYGRRGAIDSDSVIATLPIGYADGLNRHLGNGRTHMLVNGIECPTVGNICMDICMIDVTKANVTCGDRVEIFGENIPVTSIAKILDTISYEVLTSVAPRVKRTYYRE